MKRYLAIALLSMLSGNLYAGYAELISIERIHTKSNGYTYLWVSNPLTDTCDWYSEDFRFQSDTPAGQAMLSTVLSAQAQSKTITVWYNPATGSGTVNETCTETALAAITGVGL